MTSKEIEQNLKYLTDHLDPEELIYDLLLAYGISKTSVARLKKGDFNMAKNPGEVLYKGKIFFKTGEAGSLLFDIEKCAKDEYIIKQNPRFIILTDFKTFVAKDLKTGLNKDFPVAELSKHYAFFLPLTGAEIYKSTNDNKADRDASYELAKLYDILIEDNEALLHGHSHHLNLFLSRLLFCFFAEDTGIFAEEGIFSNTIANETKDDGSDMDVFLTDLFKRLSTRTGDFPTYVAEFPYVNGGLFKDEIICPKFSYKSRQILLNCGNLNWDEINPDIFGSMIQAVADPEERSDLGMHYTSVPNILKLIKPLFLDELYDEFEKQHNSSTGLKKLINRISKIKFFDPACGSGNFLIITYKEIRNLEIKILKRIIELIPEGQTIPLQFTEIKLSQFYGIEIKDFAHEMAILSLWLAEHQMNKVFESELMDFGKSHPILPLKQSGNITRGNAARTDWESVCPKNPDDEIYIIGNPPYLGYSRQNALQKEDLGIVAGYIPNYKKLDYIAIWFVKASNFISTERMKYAFVSTNSITQGEQVGLLFPFIIEKNQEIFFAYQSFKWENNAKGNAGVAVVIIGIQNSTSSVKQLFANNRVKEVKNINPYLLDATNIFIYPRRTSISDLPEMIKGSSPGDNGNLLLKADEALSIIQKYPKSEKFIKKYIGAEEFMNGSERFCIHIDIDELDQAKEIPDFTDRFRKVSDFRMASTKEATRKKSLTPYFFDEDKYIEDDFLLIPQTGSERREYLPIGYFSAAYVPSNAVRVVYGSSSLLFGILSSRMHIVWVRAIAGRLKTDMQYSNTLCYNTFPFPEINAKQKQLLTEYVFAVLDERAKFPEKTMAWLYNPETMPEGLQQAHHELDLAIERIYRLRPFDSDADRLEYLFKLYDEMTKKDTLFAKERKKKKK